jgi:large subunit ribosomal protein L23
MPTVHRTIVRPLITEKTSAAYQNRGEYAFEVHREATKPQIRAAIEQLFGVKVTNIWTMNVRGKEKRAGATRTVGHRPNWKKAIVTLREGDKIEPFFEA